MAETSAGLQQRRGFTLIEVMVTLTLISVGIMALGTMLMRSSRVAVAASAVAFQTAEMASEVSRLDAIPFANLVDGTTCDTQTTGQLPRTRCSTIATLSARSKRITVTVTPTGSHAPPAQSLVFERSTGPASPLSTP
jgi:prepilin-type N-terminal cleavage/methylation domain-containing protein